MSFLRLQPYSFRVLILFALGALRAYAATDYTIILANAEQHLVKVRLSVGEGNAQRELQLPVWNALYQIRDFAKYVNWIHAKDRAGRPLPLRQLNISRWQVGGAQDGAIVEYEMFVDSSGPFGAQFSSHHAFFNLAQVLIYPVDARDQPMTISFSMVPKEWHTATPLGVLHDGRFTALDYDRLVDSPVEIGTFQESDFDEDGAHYRVIVDAEAGVYQMDKIVGMLRKIVGSATNWMEDRPFQSYMFFYHFHRGPAGGGMEHTYSAAIDVNADVLSQSPSALASVTAHEFFHLWNVKRIRPQGLVPVDYTRENYTRALWFSEGCTSTAADFIELRGGLMNEVQFERQLASDIAELERRPAHLTQSAEQSSLDAWLEGYPYYRRPDRSISYYNKGELLGVILDLQIREVTHGKDSLRELFQWMNDNYAKKDKSFSDMEGVQEAAAALTHTDMAPFFEKYVRGTEEIPWDDFFRGVGLKLEEGRNTMPDAGFVASRNFDEPMTVSQVSAGGGAERAGLRVGDVILEINGDNVGQESSDLLDGLASGDTLRMKVQSTHAGEHELKWKVGSREQTTYRLEDLESISPEQRARRAAWLRGEAQGLQATAAN
jgi:predicted metalloprotease with PDZ domain